MSDVRDIGYGKQFADINDRIFPKDESADQVAAILAAMLGGRGSALELGVGTGRIALPLARQTKATVVGVDSSPEMLAVLRRDIDRTGTQVEVVHGDMRTYTDERRYALVYIVCASLAMVLDPEEQRESVHRAADLLAPGGSLVIETHNPSGVLAMANGSRHATFLVPYPEPNTGLLSSWTIDEPSAIWQASHLWLDNGSFRIATDVVRLTTPDEVDGYATSAGLRPTRRVSDWRGTPYSEQSPMYISVYGKPEEPR